jgi:hypothetical protein
MMLAAASRYAFKLSSRTLRRCALALLLTTELAHGARAHAEAPTAPIARLRVGAGAAQRVVELPTAEAARQLDFGPAAAAQLGIDAQLRRGRWQLGLGLRYRTSLAGRVSDDAAGPGANTSSHVVRSHAFEAGLRPGWFFGDAPNAAALRLFAGYSVRAFGSVAPLRVPRYSLHGPVLRLELVLPLPAAHMRLRLAPEAQWLASMTQELRNLAGITQSALALGAEAELSLPISDVLSLHLDYRESHAFAVARLAQSFSDVERYLLLAASYRVP